ncbi:hypothetical protein FS837_001157 [Tulasnella sp. UAMH 9824]|nr:hypothetical protein FS837_001157 [Tulasnella sp. UAMH 9824]
MYPRIPKAPPPPNHHPMIKSQLQTSPVRRARHVNTIPTRKAGLAVIRIAGLPVPNVYTEIVRFVEISLTKLADKYDGEVS